MGEVYRARDPRLNREVAIKVLPANLAEDPEALARFEREAKAVAALSHPNILAIHDVGAEGKISYSVTEFLEGETLRARIARSTLPWRKAVEFGVGIADGLSAAHSKGVIHRDLKPANIFLTSDGQLKILDFGLARLEPAPSPEGQTAVAADLLETEPGRVMGTAAYMSPEQIRGGSGDARSDIFAFGCVLYEMVTGQRAFTRPTGVDTMAAILTEEPPDIANSGTIIPPDLDRVIAHCVEKNPEDRFQSSRDLAFDLRAILTSSAVSRGLPLLVTARPRAKVWAAAAAAAGVLVLALLLWRGGGGLLESLKPSRIEALAVLPLENLSGDPEEDYFADGMTEALIADLAKIRALRVPSRTSVMQYKKAKKPLPQIARELNVDAIVEGSVTRSGNRVRITAQLIEAKKDRHMWAESYERDMRDILALQSEVARAIAREIKIQVTPQERARLARTRAVNPEAYQAYLKGSYYSSKRTEEGLAKGIAHFEQAIETDPGYALAYAGLADSYSLLVRYGAVRPSEAMPKAKAAAKKALELDNTLAEAYASLAYASLHYDWDWQTAERQFQRAIELVPNYETAHQWYARYLTAMGRFDEAIAEVKRAQQLEPLSLIINSAVGYAYYFARRYDQAIAESRKALEMDPNFSRAHFNLGLAYEQKKMFPQAIAEFQKAIASSGGPLMEAALGHAYAVAGRRAEAQEVLDRLIELSKQRYVSSYQIATIYAGLGETDQAFAWLEKAYGERNNWLAYLKVDPIFDGLRSDSRFAALVRRVGLAA